MSGEGQGAERGRDGQGRRCDGAQVNPGNMPMVTSSAIARSDDTEERCYNTPPHAKSGLCSYSRFRKPGIAVGGPPSALSIFCIYRNIPDCQQHSCLMGFGMSTEVA